MHVQHGEKSITQEQLVTDRYATCRETLRVADFDVIVRV